MSEQAKVNEQIDRLLHDAEHAEGGAMFAARMGDVTHTRSLQNKYRKLRAEAEKLFLDNPGSTWPECQWPAPKRKAEGRA